MAHRHQCDVRREGVLSPQLCKCNKSRHDQWVTQPRERVPRSAQSINSQNGPMSRICMVSLNFLPVVGYYHRDIFPQFPPVLSPYYLFKFQTSRYLFKNMLGTKYRMNTFFSKIVLPFHKKTLIMSQTSNFLYYFFNLGWNKIEFKVIGAIFWICIFWKKRKENVNSFSCFIAYYVTEIEHIQISVLGSTSTIICV